MDVTEDGVTNGILSGGISQDSMDQLVLPGVAALINEIINDSEGCNTEGDPAADCGCVGAGNKGLQALNFLREPVDGVRPSCSVDAAALKAHPVVGTALSPDIDILDAEGNLTADGRPNPDGVVDSVSIGLGFTAVKGSFELPASIPPEGEIIP